jgi:hydrogenase maturation protease
MGRRINVICFGNELHGDDGFGPAVFAALEGHPLPAGCRLFRADVAGLSALACFEDCDLAVVVDAVSGFGVPGSLHILEPGDVDGRPAAAWHGAGIAQLLAHVPHALDPAPAAVILGAELGSIEPFSARLSEPIARAVEPCVEQILSMVRG